VKGLPSGASATFSPPQTIPGTGSAAVTMSVQTVAASARLGEHQGRLAWLAAMVMVPLVLIKSRRRQLLLFVSLGLALVSADGCGARSISTADVAQQVYSLAVTGTSTNLAGVVVSHSTTVTLILQ
jgi:hypothetical protein